MALRKLLSLPAGPSPTACLNRMAISARAWPIPTPGFMRPTSITLPFFSRLRPGASDGSMARGSQMSSGESRINPRNPRAVTPAMVTGKPSTVIRLPTMAGSRLKRSFQYGQLTTATGPGAFSRSSSGPKRRPSAGLTPSIGKKLPVTQTPPTRSASGERSRT